MRPGGKSERALEAQRPWLDRLDTWAAWDRYPLRADADPQRRAMSAFAALPAGLLLIQTRQSIEPPAAALDGALAALKSFRD